MTNVFKFPENKIVREIPPNIEEIEKHRERGRQNYAEDIVNDIIENLIALLDSYGVDQDGKNFERDFTFAIDTVRSMIYRAMNVEHTLQEFVDNHVSIMKKDDNISCFIFLHDRYMIVHTLQEFVDNHVSIMKKDETGNVIIDAPKEMQDIILENLVETDREVDNED